MRIQFDGQQEFQLNAIDAVTGLFAGQLRQEPSILFGGNDAALAAIPNRLALNERELLENLRTVQAANGVARDAALLCIEQRIQTAAGERPARFWNFSVEMETGTGKTYVYVRTMLELYRRYGLSKFIVVVPSIAIREGVLKTLEMTASHLAHIYGNTPYRYYVYDSANLSRVRQFARSESVEIMIMTLAAFNKASNVIYQAPDRFGASPAHLIQAVRPVLILDEPQNMGSEKSIAALAALNPLLALRYSATHKEPYNLVYRLTPYDAYRQGLVKRIEVASVVSEDRSRPFVRVDEIRADKRTLTARVRVQKLQAGGTLHEATLTVRPGDSLQEKTGRVEYAGWEVDEINLSANTVRFANYQELRVGQAVGPDQEAVFEAQLRATVDEHLRKQERLRPHGLKVLSLFFIDRVDNYAGEEPIIRRLFDRVFDELKTRYPAWRERTAAEVQRAYFAERRTSDGRVILEDSKTGEAQRDQEAYDLIMRQKEQLLSLEEPVSFIFSHSALREGWDNPNVYQICVLRQVSSEMSRRQQIGRGVRLAVNQEGLRVRDEHLNVLTVVANEGYERFVDSLQSEIADEYRELIEARYGKPIGRLSDEERKQIEVEYGAGILPPRPADARKRGTATLRQVYTLRPEFKELWERIRLKTRYAVRIDTERLVRDVTAALAGVEIERPRVSLVKARVALEQESAFEALQMSAARTLVDLAGKYPLPNLVEVMANLMAHTTPPMVLTRRTLLEIIRQAPDQQALVECPHEFAGAAVRVIKAKLAEQLVEGIRYERINEWYEMTQLEGEIESWKEYLEPAKKSVYDEVVCDSQVERQFVRDLEAREDVKLYIKLPGWFTVPTPIGEYNPDWALVMTRPGADGGADEERLYLVSETKGSMDPAALRPDEQRKIHCGARHFEDALGVGFKVAARAGDLP